MADLRTLVAREMDLAGTPTSTFEDLYRRRDRKQRNRRLAAAALAIAIAAAAIGTTLRAFEEDTEPEPVQLPTSAADWMQVPFVDGNLTAIAEGGPGLVAVGSTFEGRAAIWTSIDGRTWDQTPETFGYQDLMDVTKGGPGLVAVQIGNHGYAPQTGPKAPILTSADAITWTRAPDDAVFGGSWMRAVTAGGPGLVAVGSDVEGPQAWYSADGITWEIASVPTPEGDLNRDGGHIDSWMQDVITDGERLVAVGQIGIAVGPNGVRYDPAIWTSADGITWTGGGRVDEVFPRSSEVLDIAASSSGFVIVGTVYVRGVGATTGVWFSSDGTDWQEVSAAGDAFVSTAPEPRDDSEYAVLAVSSVEAGQAGFVAFGTDSRCTYGGDWLCSPSRAALWTSVDGKKWIRVPPDAVFTIGPVTRVGDTAITRWGSGFIVTGRYWDPRSDEGREQRTTTWIAEPPVEREES